MMRDEALEQIQSKIAYLERAANELSDVVFRQHNEIRALETQVKSIKERLSGAQLEETIHAPEQERPPHY
jgi:uncharacterized coiled-coil protein SlyX